MPNEVGPSRRTVGVRTGGRSERVVASVLEAAIAELAQVGYPALRLDDVATRAGVAKTTIYRRWPTKAALLGAALRNMTSFGDPVPDTGSLRDDLLQMLERSLKLLATPEGRAVARLITTESTDPELDTVVSELKNESRRWRAKVVDQAVARGELAAGIDPVLVTDCIWAPIFSRTIRFGERVDRATCARIIDLVVTGAEHGGGRAAKPRR